MLVHVAKFQFTHQLFPCVGVCTQAFTTLALLNMLRSALQQFPNALKALAEVRPPSPQHCSAVRVGVHGPVVQIVSQGLVAADRIQAFLEQPEVDPSNCSTTLPSNPADPECVRFVARLRELGCEFPVEDVDAAALVTCKATFQWESAATAEVRVLRVHVTVALD